MLRLVGISTCSGSLDAKTLLPFDLIYYLINQLMQEGLGVGGALVLDSPYRFFPAVLVHLASSSLMQEGILCRQCEFLTRLNRSKRVKLLKEKRLQAKKNGGQRGHGRFARFNFMPK